MRGIINLVPLINIYAMIRTFYVSYVLTSRKKLRRPIAIEKTTALNKTVKAKTIREVFTLILAEEPRSNILWIIEQVAANKQKLVYNKFYYVDKKTGLPKGPKLFNMDEKNQNKYLHKQPKSMILYLIREKRYHDAYLYVKHDYFLPLIWKSKSTYVKSRNAFEKYCIRNGFGIGAQLANELRMKKSVIEKRRLSHFSLSQHVKLYDPTHKTVGCGCDYCRLLYLAELYRVQMNTHHKVYEDFVRLSTYRLPYDNRMNEIPITTSGRRLYLKRIFVPINEAREKMKYHLNLAKRLKKELEIPTIKKLPANAIHSNNKT